MIDNRGAIKHSGTYDRVPPPQPQTRGANVALGILQALAGLILVPLSFLLTALAYIVIIVLGVVLGLVAFTWLVASRPTLLP